MVVSRRCLVAVLAIAMVFPALAQEKPTVPVSQIIDTYNLTKAVAHEISEARDAIKSDGDLRGFFEAVVSAQKRMEPSIVLIGQTDSPKEVQPYAISVAIAAKSLELAMWSYINTFVTDKQLYLDNADALLRQSIDELERAALIAPKEE